MKTQTFKNRTKSVSSNSKGMQLAKSLLTEKNRVNTCWTSGKGRFITNMNYQDNTIDVLERAGLKKGIDFIVGNDSPRGGKTGQFIELTSKGKRKRLS